MKVGIKSLALVLGIAQTLSACQVPANPRVTSASKLPIAGAGGAVVRTAPGCSEEEGGRHFGETTPFSGNPFNGCWPQ